MTFRKFVTSSTFIRIILVITIILLLYIASIFYKHSIALKESGDLLVHSYKTELQLEQLLTNVKDAETGQRGYIITADSVFLQPYLNAHDKIDALTIELKVLLANNIQQYNNLDTLLNLIDLRLRLLETSLILVRNPDKKLIDNNMVRGKNVMDRIRKQMNIMADVERIYFEDHEKKYAHEVILTPFSTLVLMIFSLLILFVSYLKINKDLIVQKRTNAELRIATESFQHAEVIGKLSSWQWHIGQDNYVFSDNFYGLVGIPLHSIEPSLENFLSFVHPDDRKIVSESLRPDPSRLKTTPTAYFRLIRKDGEIRYFKSIGKLTYVDDRSVFIGINSDITEQHLSSLALEERNHQLEQSNADLESFNHVASHDLQEPLRKIQTFISRIQEKDALVLSESGKEYFGKIQMSARQMRSLINDLLLFSRTTKTDKNFKKTDLNELFENAKQEMIQDIEEKKAVVICEQLPVLKVIPFQIQQIFMNLIGNSLKYSNPTVAPVISISYELTEDKVRNKKFHKISVTDNGLGFEQKYAENIFELFYRLHAKSDYQGSGIGLSICKKIMENHNGFINAQGTPDKGSTFSFFLPV